MKTTLKSEQITLTPEQKALWIGLKDCRLDGREFNIRPLKNQSSIEFVCPTENLVIEVSDIAFDGNSSDHEEASIGVGRNKTCVLHFPHIRIRQDLGLVLAQIRGHFTKMLSVC